MRRREGATQGGIAPFFIISGTGIFYSRGEERTFL